jgi:hypothetical protein
MLVKNMERHHWEHIRGIWDVKPLLILVQSKPTNIIFSVHDYSSENKLRRVHLRLEVLPERSAVIMQMRFLSLISPPLHVSLNYFFGLRHRCLKKD